MSTPSEQRYASLAFSVRRPCTAACVCPAPQKEVYGSERVEFRYVYRKDGRKVVCCDVAQGRCTLDMALTKWNADRLKTFQADAQAKAIDISRSQFDAFLKKLFPQTAPSTVRGLERMPLPTLEEVLRGRVLPQWR